MTTDALANVGQKSWELSLYELHRQPQDVITDNTEIAVSPRSLHSELMCPICLDMLRNTMTTKECLHRFCHDCIITALRSGNKECPTCRKKLVSKRSLRPDPNFDMLISKIHPNRDELEAQQARLLENIQKQNLVGMSLEENLRMQALSRATHKIRKLSSVDSLDRSESPSSQPDGEMGVIHTSLTKKKTKRCLEDTEDITDTERSSTNSTPNGASLPPPQTEIELVFRPLPHDGAKDDKMPSETRYVKTTTNATVEHLVKYLSMRYKLEGQRKRRISCEENEVIHEDDSNESLFTLYIQNGPGEFHPLASTMTLRDIKEKFFKTEGALALHYAYKIQERLAVCPEGLDPPLASHPNASSENHAMNH